MYVCFIRVIYSLYDMSNIQEYCPLNLIHYQPGVADISPGCCPLVGVVNGVMIK